MTPDHFHRALACTQLRYEFEGFSKDLDFINRCLSMSYACQNKHDESSFTHVWRFMIRMDDLDPENHIYQIMHTATTDTYELHPAVARQAMSELLKVFNEAMSKAKGPELIV